MAHTNPLAGGPDYVRSLCNAIHAAEGTYKQPPATGGGATSLRFPRDRAALLDALASASGWNRNQVVNALVDKGLFVLFSELGEKRAVELVEKVSNSIPERHMMTLHSMRRGEIWAAILQQLRGLRAGLGKPIPVRNIWLTLARDGFSRGGEISETLAWAQESGRLEYSPEGPGGLGTISLTDAGYVEL